MKRFLLALPFVLILVVPGCHRDHHHDSDSTLPETVQPPPSDDGGNKDDDKDKKCKKKHKHGKCDNGNHYGEDHKD